MPAAPGLRYPAGAWAASPVRQRLGLFLLIGLFLLTGLTLVCIDPIPQDPAYHQLANTQAWLGIANAADVLSNLPFLIVGACGLIACSRHPPRARELRGPTLGMLTGILLTGIGSAYYHLDPNNATLLWDRLPIAFTFMCLFTLVLADRVDCRFARAAWLPLVLAALGSVLYWHWTEAAGRGDLRPYALIQFYPLVALPILLTCFPARQRGTRHLVRALAAYLAAKLFEHYDVAIFAATGCLSGHTLKHLAASWASYEIGRWALGGNEPRTALGASAPRTATSLAAARAHNYLHLNDK